MPNLALKKVPMPEQEPDVRNANFREVTLGYTEAMAIEEAKRCLNCRNKPCVGGCPVSVQIPEFIERVVAGDFADAYEIITSTNNLPAICGRVCPQESQCRSFVSVASKVSRWPSAPRAFCCRLGHGERTCLADQSRQEKP